MSNFLKDLVKVATSLYSHSMRDRYDDDGEYTPVGYTNRRTPGEILKMQKGIGKTYNKPKTQYREWYDAEGVHDPKGIPRTYKVPTYGYMGHEKSLEDKIKAQKKYKPKFFTSTKAPAAANVKIKPKSFDYAAFSKGVDFKKIAPFIASEEAYIGDKWYYKSQTTGFDGRHAYGTFQIYDGHFDPDHKWYNPKFDKYFDTAAKIYNQNPTKYGGTKGEVINPKDVKSRRKMLQIADPAFNAIDIDSLSYSIARDIYNTQGVAG
tara:strand:+ start:84 stop:872 length:789 start_codon:yes stop_codon:yes gene_type:complete